jgi:hypothetical protein
MKGRGGRVIGQLKMRTEDEGIQVMAEFMVGSRYSRGT